MPRLKVTARSNSPFGAIDDAQHKFVIKVGTGLKGEKGDKGDRGLQGARGLQGIQGIQGVKGDKGDKGEKGDIGLQGVRGDTGENAIFAFEIDTGGDLLLKYQDGQTPPDMYIDTSGYLIYTI